MLAIKLKQFQPFCKKKCVFYNRHFDTKYKNKHKILFENVYTFVEKMTEISYDIFWTS